MLDLLPYLDFRNNPFNLLGLSVQAEHKDIRHRREDIEAALETGTPLEGFDKSKFLSSQPDDIRSAVADSFAKLEDPKERFIHSVFWFWPLNRGTDDYLLKCAAGGSEEGLNWAMRGWDRDKDFNGFQRRAARHNLALAHLFSARKEEEETLGSTNVVDSFVVSYFVDIWNETAARWYEFTDDESLWSGLTRKIEALDDPRLLSSTVRHIRNALPEVFLRIHFQYAERHSDRNSILANHHMSFLKDSAKDGLVDVRGMFEDRYSEILSETDRRIAVWRRENLSVNGFAASRNVLEYAEPKDRFVRMMFGDKDESRLKFCDIVAGFVHSAIVAYGNATRDYRPCVEILDRIIPFAPNPFAKQIIEEDRDVFRKNCRLAGIELSSNESNPEDSSSPRGSRESSNRAPDSSMTSPASQSNQASDTVPSDNGITPKTSIRTDQAGPKETPEPLKGMRFLRNGKSSPVQRPNRKITPETEKLAFGTKENGLPPGWTKAVMAEVCTFIFAKLIPLLILVGICFGMWWSFHSDTKVEEERAAKQRVIYESWERAQKRKEVEERAERALWASRRKPTPPSGTVTMLVDTECDSGLQIKTKTGANYLVKLVSWRGKKPIETIFVRGGKTVEVAVPSGRYEIRYASGTTWYGDEYLFGPETRCAKADELFSFSKETGYTLALYEVSNGNLPTSGMSLEDF